MQAEKLTALNLTATNENLNFDSCTEEGREEQGSSNSAPSSQEQLKFMFPLCQHKKFNTHEKISFLSPWPVVSGKKTGKNYLSSCIMGLLLGTSEYETYEK